MIVDNNRDIDNRISHFIDHLRVDKNLGPGSPVSFNMDGGELKSIKNRFMDRDKYAHLTRKYLIPAFGFFSLPNMTSVHMVCQDCGHAHDNICEYQSNRQSRTQSNTFGGDIWKIFDKGRTFRGVPFVDILQCHLQDWSCKYEYLTLRRPIEESKHKEIIPDMLNYIERCGYTKAEWLTGPYLESSGQYRWEARDFISLPKDEPNGLDMYF